MIIHQCLFLTTGPNCYWRYNYSLVNLLCKLQLIFPFGDQIERRLVATKRNLLNCYYQSFYFLFNWRLEKCKAAGVAHWYQRFVVRIPAYPYCFYLFLLYWKDENEDKRFKGTKQVHQMGKEWATLNCFSFSKLFAATDWWFNVMFCHPPTYLRW